MSTLLKGTTLHTIGYPKVEPENNDVITPAQDTNHYDRRRNFKMNDLVESVNNEMPFYSSY